VSKASLVSLHLEQRWYILCSKRLNVNSYQLEQTTTQFVILWLNNMHGVGFDAHSIIPTELSNRNNVDWINFLSNERMADVYHLAGLSCAHLDLPLVDKRIAQPNFLFPEPSFPGTGEFLFTISSLYFRNSHPRVSATKLLKHYLTAQQKLVLQIFPPG
jgi:hypothetical protein